MGWWQSVMVVGTIGDHLLFDGGERRGGGRLWWMPCWRPLRVAGWQGGWLGGWHMGGGSALDQTTSALQGWRRRKWRGERVEMRGQPADGPLHLARPI